MKKAVVLVLTMTFTGWHIISAQKTRQETQKEKEAAVTKMIQNRNYVFMVQSVLPMRGGSRQLSPGYDVWVASDSVISYLPYFGRAYSAPPPDGGIKFTSVNFDYTVKERRKSGWNITISPKDAMDVRQLFFIVFPNGSTNLILVSLC